VTVDLRLASLRAFAAFLLTSLLVVWLADLALKGANLGNLTLGVLLRGTDPFRGQTVLEALAVSLGRSGALLLVALGAAALIGVAAGIAYALSSSAAIRAAAWAVGTAGVSLPSFFWAMLLQLVVVLLFIRTQTRVLPTSGFGLDDHLVLPALALGARPAAYVFRTTATALDQVRRGDYVRTAHAKGLLGSVIAKRHIFPNAAPSIVSGIGLGARTALSSLAIVEYVFSWNGAGYAFIHSIANGRAAFATLIAVVFALVFGALAVGVDAVARALVPRSRS
jgi:ABC-type dipeptide/oligopeptide/nickel transport system permease component